MRANGKMEKWKNGNGVIVKYLNIKTPGIGTTPSG